MPDEQPTDTTPAEPVVGIGSPTDWPPDNLLGDDRPVSPATSSSRIMFTAEPETPEREKCPTCRGTGWKMTTSDFLRESIGLIEGHEDEVVRLFYSNLIDAAPYLAALFPDDLLDPESAPGDRTGRGQRDRLVAALTALATRYDRGNPEKMDALDTILDGMGRAHSAFPMPDGSVRRASIGEYYAVTATAVSTFEQVGGEKWLPVYSVAWNEALEYASARMLAESIRNPQTFARTVRAPR